MTTWFCDAYAGWQKGSVENTNGRLRRQLPRHLDLDTLSRADLQEIVLSHNLTPRKCLGYMTPIQAFFKGLGKDVQIRFASLAGLCAWRGNPPVMADPDDVVALGRSFVAANVASLGHLAERLATLPLDRAIDLILGARVVYVLGIDRSHATATYLAYALNRAGVQAVPMVGLGHLLREHATNMHADDVLVAISFPPYAEERVAVVATWRQRGNAVLAVTNSTVSPIADGARAVLAVEDAELHGFRSLSALICLVQTRVMGLAYRKRRVEGGIDIDA